MVVVAVIDDHRLLSLLAALERPSGRYATTCSWWWRLTSAFAAHRRGALTRRLEGLDQGIVAAVRQTVQNLPTHLVIVDLRLLIPAMGVLADHHPVNQLAAEAVAAAAYLQTSIEVEIDTPEIRLAALAEHVDYHVTRLHSRRPGVPKLATANIMPRALQGRRGDARVP